MVLHHINNSARNSNNHSFIYMTKLVTYLTIMVGHFIFILIAVGNKIIVRLHFNFLYKHMYILIEYIRIQAQHMNDFHVYVSELNGGFAYTIMHGCKMEWKVAI